jgi:hypothetical protein
MVILPYVSDLSHVRTQKPSASAGQLWFHCCKSRRIRFLGCGSSAMLRAARPDSKGCGQRAATVIADPPLADLKNRAWSAVEGVLLSNPAESASRSIGTQ